MTPNPSVNQYVCAIFALPTGFGMDTLLARRWQLVEHFLRYSIDTSLEDVEIEEQATFNALTMLVGQFLGEMVLNGKDAKKMWGVFGMGVQQTLSLYADDMYSPSTD